MVILDGPDEDLDKIIICCTSSDCGRIVSEAIDVEALFERVETQEKLDETSGNEEWLKLDREDVVVGRDRHQSVPDCQPQWSISGMMDDNGNCGSGCHSSELECYDGDDEPHRTALLRSMSSFIEESGCPECGSGGIFPMPDIGEGVFHCRDCGSCFGLDDSTDPGMLASVAGRTEDFRPDRPDVPVWK